MADPTITFFTAPKAFRNPHIATIQNNAIASWAKIPGAKLILCGKDEGVEEAAARVGAEYIADIQTSDFGTPLLSSIFSQSIARATTPLVCYINADIMLLSDFAPAAKIAAKRGRFLMVGRRWNVDNTEPINFSESNWEARLKHRTLNDGELFLPSGIDYFLFPKNDFIGSIRPFIVGRPRWDNWFIFNALRSRCPVIDATRAVLAVHQNHDYRHVPQARNTAFEGPEFLHNEKLVETPNYVFTISDASHLMTRRGRLVPALTVSHLSKRLKSLPLLHPKTKSIGRPLRRVAEWTGLAGVLGV